MHFAVLGAAGQLGQALAARLDGTVTLLTREQADVTASDRLRRCLGQLAADVVINCAAYNFVDRAETEIESAFAVNAFGPRALAMICRDLNTTIVHFSTDYVFGLDATRCQPYSEGDVPGPLSVYGASKLAGENFVRSICPRHFVIRTCGLYGPGGSGGKGRNFPTTMLRLAREQRPLRVVADQICTPSYTSDVAETAVALIATNRFGLYHLTNSGSCSWYDFTRKLMELAGLAVQIEPIKSSEYASPARRPGYSVLNCDALARIGVGPLRRWEEALESFLTDQA